MSFKKAKLMVISFFTILCLSLNFNLHQIQAAETIEISIERDPTTFSSQNPQYIRGTFTIHASGPENMSWIAIYFNDELQLNVTGSSISFKFNTQFFPEGDYALYAKGLLSSGNIITSNNITTQFRQESSGPIWYILGGCGAIILAVFIYRKKMLKDSRRKPKKDDIQILDL